MGTHFIFGVIIQYSFTVVLIVAAWAPGSSFNQLCPWAIPSPVCVHVCIWVFPWLSGTYRYICCDRASKEWSLAVLTALQICQPHRALMQEKTQGLLTQPCGDQEGADGAVEAGRLRSHGLLVTQPLWGTLALYCLSSFPFSYYFEYCCCPMNESPSL